MRILVQIIFILSLVSCSKKIHTGTLRGNPVDPAVAPPVGPPGKEKRECSQLNSSILVFHIHDFKRIIEQMKKVVELGNKNVLFVPTLGSELEKGENRQLRNYCYLVGAADCRPLTAEVIRNYTKELKEFMKIAQLHDLNVAFVPHLDAGGESSGAWRNNTVFDPVKTYVDPDLKKLDPSYRGYSYDEVMIQPIVNSVRGLLADGKKIYLSMQGEMGATIFHHASSYQRIFRRIRKEIPSPLLKLGISMNFNVVSGRDFRYTPEQLSAVQELVDASDFIGISAYGPVSVPPVAKDFNNSIDIMVAEFAAHGITISPKTELQFSEVSLGGGSMIGDSANNGVAPASKAEEAASGPYSGIYGDYDPTKDPWKNPELRNLRVGYHRALLDFLSTGGQAPWKVGSAFLWNTNSWDVQGLYNSNSQGYRDDEITEFIRDYNLKDCP